MDWVKAHLRASCIQVLGLMTYALLWQRLPEQPSFLFFGGVMSLWGWTVWSRTRLRQGGSDLCLFLLAVTGIVYLIHQTLNTSGFSADAHQLRRLVVALFFAGWMVMSCAPGLPWPVHGRAFLPSSAMLVLLGWMGILPLMQTQTPQKAGALVAELIDGGADLNDIRVACDRAERVWASLSRDAQKACASLRMLDSSALLVARQTEVCSATDPPLLKRLCGQWSLSQGRVVSGLAALHSASKAGDQASRKLHEASMCWRHAKDDMPLSDVCARAPAHGLTIDGPAHPTCFGVRAQGRPGLLKSVRWQPAPQGWAWWLSGAESPAAELPPFYGSRHIGLWLRLGPGAAVQVEGPDQREIWACHSTHGLRWPGEEICGDSGGWLDVTSFHQTPIKVTLVGHLLFGGAKDMCFATSALP